MIGIYRWSLFVCFVAFAVLPAFSQNVTVNPTTISFGNQVEGTSSSVHNVTLKNGQGTAITIGSITTSLSDYAATDNCPVSPATLAPAASCTISITFSPSVLGTRSGTLTVVDSGTSSPQLVTLSGNGTAPSLVSIVVTPTTASVAAGYTQQFTAMGTYSNGTTQNLTSTASWTSSNTSVATIKIHTGVATTLTAGTATITAASGTISGSATLTVTAAVLTSIAVTPATASVAAGYTQQFAATGTYSNGTTQNLTSSASWTSSATSTATVSSSGLATSVAPGAATMTATSGTISGSAKLTVTAAVLTSIVVTPGTASVAAGYTQQFTATGTYSNGTTQNLTSTASWTSSNTSVATIKIHTGVATTLTAGTATITAISGTISGSAALTVTAAVLTSIAVTPATASVPAGEAQQFTATGTYSNGTTQNLTSGVSWSSSATAIATVSSVGLATSVTPGTATMTATSGTISGSAILTVTAAVLTSIAVTPTTASVAAGYTQQFTAMGTYSNGTTQNLTSTASWTSSNTSVATIKIHTGVATTLTAGTATITAISGTISGSAALTVTAAVLTSIAVTPATASVPAGEAQQFTATGTYSNGTTQNLTSSASWTSSNTAVATIKIHTGVATTLTPGTARMTAASGTISGSAALTVTAAVLTSIAVTPATASVPAGEAQQFTATGTYSNGTTQNLTSGVSWSSSATAIATVSSVGLATSVTPGTATMTATSGTISGSAALTVTAAVLTSIAVTPTTASVPAGEAQQFAATGTYSNGTTQNLTSSVSWSSSVTAIATVSSGGLATGIAQGETNITASTGAINGSAALTVTPAVLASISISPGSASIAKGMSQQFSAIGTYSDGSTQNLTSTVNWSSSLATVATISSGGSATGVGVGTASITASSSTISATATLSVGLPVLVSMAVTPVNPSFALGTTQQLAATGTYSDGSTLDLTNTATWSTGDGTIATVNGQGLVTSVALGSSSVTASSGLIIGSTTLTVNPAVLVSIAVTPVIPTIPLGTTQQFTATGTYTDGSTQNITGTVQWSSDTPTVATISNSANVAPLSGVATGVGQGTATITASFGSVAGSTTLTVTSAVLVSLAITPATPSIALGTTQQFTATGTFTDGSTQNLTSSVTWSSDTLSTATINSAGLAQSVEIGTANITATSGTVSGTTTLTVTAAVLVSIAINPPTATVALGTTQQFTATGTFSDGSTQDLTQIGQWSSTTATVATISNTAGTAGLASTLGTGTTTIGISSGLLSATATLLVNPASLLSIAINPQSPTIALGTSQQFTATGTYTDGSTQDLTSVVTWGSSSATVAIISNSVGSYGLATTSGQGTANISATSNSISSSTPITVTGPSLVSIAITPADASIPLTTSLQFAATGTYSDGSTEDLTASAIWASDSPTVATVIGSGLVMGSTMGTANISASSGTVTNSTSVAVTAPALLSIAISPGSVLIAKGTSQQFTATGTYSDGSTQNLTSTVSWTSSLGNVATVGSGGLATGVGIGTASVMASVTASSGTISATGTLSVGLPVLVSMAVTPVNPSFALGTTQQFAATGTYSDGGTLDLTNTATWSTANDTVATVSGPGLVASVALGGTSVTATSGSISGSTTLTVNPAVLVSIAVTPAIPTIPLGTTQQFTATGTYTDGSTQNITGTVQWSSDTPTVATISNTTGSQGVASSEGQGRATITASVGLVTGSTMLTVTSAALASLAITPATPSLALGTSQQFTAAGTFTDGSTQNLTSTATWSSDTPLVATINNAGLASNVGIGTATITAASGGILASTVLTVTPAVLVSITINPPAATIPLGVTQQFTATGTFSDGTTQDVTPSGQWSSTTATVATISNSTGTAGLATALGTGTTTIGISSGGVSASAPLIVNPAALASIAIAPQTPTIALGTSQQFTATGTYTDGSTQDVTSMVTWSSSAATVAIISNSVGSYGFATSSGQGNATITATSASVASSTAITVGQANVSSISVTPSSATVILGAAQQFTAMANYSDGSTQDITQSATWASSSPNVATVSSTGLAISMLVGTAAISASADSATGSALLTVNAPVPVSLVVAPANPTVSAGAQLQFAATLFYSNGSSIDVTSAVTWSSSNPDVATVSSTGLALSLTGGVTTIEANWGANLLTSPLTMTVDAPNTFFVATNGNDAWSGELAVPNSNSSDGPFASLSRAQYAVEKAPKPATVMVRNGTYYLALTPSTANSYPGTLAFTPADSGASSSAPVTWQNYPGETPVISGGVPANADPISGVGLHLQWTNIGNWYQAPLPSNLSNNVAIRPFESLYYNGQRRLRSRIHDNGTSGYPSIGYFMQNGQCVASPSTPAGQQPPTLASCNLGTFLRVTNTISPTSALGQGCPYASGVVNDVTVSKCLDRFVYTNTSGGDPIQAWQNLNGSYSSIPASPCTSNNTLYPAGDVELTLIDAWSVDMMRVNCVDIADNVIFLFGPAKGGGTVASSDTNYNYLGPTVGHRYMIENTWDAFNDALTPTSSQYGITGIWFLDRHTVPWVLNYIANHGENPNTDYMVIPQLGGTIPGAPATDYIGASLITASKLDYVTFQGITFEVDSFYPNSIGFNNDGNGEMSLPQAIDCENCQFVTFNNVTVRHTSASGILAAATAATPACSGSNPPACVVIENSTLYDIGDSGLRIGHTVSTSDTTATVVQDVLARNNLIQGYSRVFADGEGIAEANGNNNQYSYNTIADGYHAAISICQGGCGPTKSGVSVSGNNIISSYNLISNIMQGLTSDGGAIYYNVGNGGSSGTGNSVSSNVINNVTDSYIIDNTTTAGVAVSGSAYGGEGIQLDAQSADVEAANNVVYNLSAYAINISEGLASSKETQNIFTNNIFAFANLGMFSQETPWPSGCPSSPITQVDVTNNIFYFDRFSTSIPSFYVIQGCKDSCKQAYDTYQNFQGNSYWRMDGQFANNDNAFQVLTTQGLNSNNTCKLGPTTALYFTSQSAPDWQTGGQGVPVAMNEDLPPNATVSYQPPFTASGLATDLPSDYLFVNGQTPPTQFVTGDTNLTITNAHSSLPSIGTVPPTFPTYVYGSPQNKF